MCKVWRLPAIVVEYIAFLAMLITSRAIILSIVRYSDDSLIADSFTEEQGRVGFLVKISRSARTAVRHTLFQPLAVLEITWDHRVGTGLVRPKSVRSALPFASLPYDPYKSAMGLFIAEFLHHALRSEPASTHLYNYIEQSINWLDTCTRNFSNFHLVFLVRLTYFLGISPNVEHPERYKFFDLRAGSFVTDRPNHVDYLVDPEAQFIPMLLRMRYETMHIFHFNGAERTRLLRYINTYYRLHLEGMPDLKSLDVLSEVF